MKNDGNIELQIEEALNSIASIQRATPRPYLFTRLNARLNKQAKSIWERAAVFISQPAVMAISLCLILTVNISVLIINLSSTNNTTNEGAVNITNDEDEYSTTYVTIDNIENP